MFRKPTIEQLGEFIAPTFQALIDGAGYVDDRLREIIGELEPDVIVEDNVVAFPALPACGRPWVRIVSCNPTEVRDPDVPPPFSGYPVDDRASGPPTGTSARARTARCTRRSARCARSAARRRCRSSSSCTSRRGSTSRSIRARPTTRAPARSARRWHNLQTSVRATDAPWELPPQLAGREGPLVYLSLGSLGSADVELMQKLVDSLADAPYRVIVSKGPQHELLRLPDTMAGEEFLPQTSILPQVDAVITHGGNNTVTECLHFGKPMVVLPLFWDQYDNAQRVQETGFGLRLDTYGHAPEELLRRGRPVLADAAMRGASPRLGAAAGAQGHGEGGRADRGRRHPLLGSPPQPFNPVPRGQEGRE